MSIPHVVQRTANILRRPSIQRLIMLLVSMLLAMSLGYVTIVVAYPIWEKHVAFLPTIVASLEIANSQALHTPERASVSTQVLVLRTEQYQTERRSV